MRGGSRRRFLKAVVVPATAYLLIFVLYTWPWTAHFSSEYFTDTGDGYQNVWNMWWVNHSGHLLHQLPGPHRPTALPVLRDAACSARR